MSQQIDPLITKAARQTSDQELAHAFARSAVKMIEWVRNCEAAPSTKLKVLSQIADSADWYLARLKAEVE